MISVYPEKIHPDNSPSAPHDDERQAYRHKKIDEAENFFAMKRPIETSLLSDVNVVQMLQW